ncbi:hypothetical protein [Aureibacter tunicatorum]|uniref:Uncharacterized protein n=1 Tax=Aureibacter tunicatorum TaxID=866807 RepID=A0AAE3XRN7_9BACT|nr:hypothetical protein [Aureibacter tunicatorum]MDR6241503.1 hypothetical protein [Aureibacter tunicatorum]BDD07039.1 hypothetical protein AUTU_45220 [Aureibacter tunicatorum]
MYGTIIGFTLLFLCTVLIAYWLYVTREDFENKAKAYHKEAEGKPYKKYLKNLKLGNLYTIPMRCNLFLQDDHIQVISYIKLFKRQYYQSVYELRMNGEGSFIPHDIDIKNVKLKQRTLDQGLEFSFDISYPPKTPFVSSYTEIILYDLDKQTRVEVLDMFEKVKI